MPAVRKNEVNGLGDYKCIFCRIAAKEIKANVVYEDEDVIAFEDLKAQAPTHILVIPKRHIEKISDLKRPDAEIFGKMALAANIVAEKTGISGSGYRLVANCGKDAGQEVLHIHIHLLGGRKFLWPPG